MIPFSVSIIPGKVMAIAGKSFELVLMANKELVDMGR